MVLSLPPLYAGIIALSIQTWWIWPRDATGWISGLLHLLIPNYAISYFQGRWFLLLFTMSLRLSSNMTLYFFHAHHYVTPHSISSDIWIAWKFFFLIDGRDFPFEGRNFIAKRFYLNFKIIQILIYYNLHSSLLICFNALAQNKTRINAYVIENDWYSRH